MICWRLLTDKCLCLSHLNPPKHWLNHYRPFCHPTVGSYHSSFDWVWWVWLAKMSRSGIREEWMGFTSRTGGCSPSHWLCCLNLNEFRDVQPSVIWISSQEPVLMYYSDNILHLSPLRIDGVAHVYILNLTTLYDVL